MRANEISIYDSILKTRTKVTSGQNVRKEILEQSLAKKEDKSHSQSWSNPVSVLLLRLTTLRPLLQQLSQKLVTSIINDMAYITFWHYKCKVRDGGEA